MIKKLLHLPSKSITGAAFVIATSTFLSRLMAIIRDRVLAHHYGDGQIMDAYYAAFKIPDLMFNLLVIGALSTGFIPLFTRLFEEDKKKAWKLAQNIINLISITLAIVCGLGIVCAPYISKLIAPGLDPNYKNLLIQFTRIMFLSPFILGISTIMGGILQSLRQFLLFSLAPLLYNLGIILGVTLLVPLFGLSGLAWGVVLGALLHAAIQIYGAYYNGFRWKPYVSTKDEHTREVGKLMLPRTLGLAASQLNIIVFTILASTLPVGSIAAFNYASNLQGVPVGLIGIPFALAVFPLLASSAKEKNKTFNSYLSFSIRQILFLIIPLSIIFLLLRAQIVRVVLGSGKFDWDATLNTANALAFFALSMFAQSLIHLLARAFYALANTFTPFIIGIICELCSIIIALILIKPEFTLSGKTLWFHGVSGLAFASSLGIILNVIILFIILRTKIGSIEDQKILTMLYKIILAAIVMALTIQGIKYPLSTLVDMNRFWGILLHGFISGIIGLLVYIIICYIMRVEELKHMVESLKKKWLKTNNLPSVIEDEQQL